ncbi:MAG: hypothetical protein WBC65_10820, partial [Ignavibacteria bacterium]
MFAVEMYVAGKGKLFPARSRLIKYTLCRPACRLAIGVEMHLVRQAGSRPQENSRELSVASLRAKINNGEKMITTKTAM